MKMKGLKFRNLLLAFLSLTAAFAVRAEFTCSVKLEGTAQAGVERSGAVNWKNDGPALAAPLVRVSAGDGVVVRLTANDAWASSIEFLVTSSGLPPSQLHAQESGSLPFLFRSAAADGKLELSYTTASADKFPWSEIGASLKPSSVTDEAWSFALKTLKTRFGATWDTYLARFRSDVDLFAQNGCFERRMDRLMQYELARALGTDSVIPSLSEAQDAARSARGLGLALTRTYPSSVSARFSSGMFGYGWTDNLSTVAELTDAKTLVFRTPGGVSCTFTKASGSWQSEDARDRTRLTETASAYVLAYQSGTVQTFAKTNMRTASIEDNGGNRLTFTWNGTQLAKIAHTDGQSLTFASANGLLASVTDDSGRKTTYAYSNGLLASVTSPDGLTTRYEYRPADGSINARALTRILYPDGTTREFAYGEDGLVASLSLDGGKEKSTIVRRDGEVTITGSDGSTTVMKTGLTGETYETRDALGGTSVSRYGADGLLKAVVTPSGLTSTLKHDALGRIVQTTSAGEATTSFAYEETFGNLRSVTDAKGHAVTYGYDSKGRGTSVTFPDNSSSRVEYNSRGDVVKTYNRRGESVAYAYDARGRLTQKTWSNGRTFTYAYDAHGNVTAASDSETGTVKMEYDTAERMTKISYPGGRGFTFEYDAYGRLTRRSSFDGTAECFAYDARGRLASVTDGEGNLYLRNVYDETTGRLVRQENGNGTSTDYRFDALGRTTSIEHLNADGKIVEALEYCYDVDGRCIRTSSVFGEERYEYDKDGQVTLAFYPDSPAETFAYDAVGNRTTANAANYTVNALNQYTAVSASSSTSSATFTYDRDGNLTSMTDADGTTIYGYDTLNRLVSVKNASAGLDWSCKYDALGNRVSVTENGVTTERVYLQGSLPSVAAEYVNGELQSRHILVGAVRIADVSDTIRYLHADLIGSVRLVTDADGYTQSRATYRAFGELRGGWDMDGIDGYVGTLGVETDSTGLLFMRNRYYSPALGRFIQMDPIGVNGEDVNLYRYGENQPMRNIDPKGFVSWNSAVGAISGVAGFGVGKNQTLADYGAGLAINSLYGDGVHNVRIIGGGGLTLSAANKSARYLEYGGKIVGKTAKVVGSIASVYSIYQDYNSDNYIGLALDVAGFIPNPWIKAGVLAWNVGYLLGELAFDLFGDKGGHVNMTMVGNINREIIGQIKFDKDLAVDIGEIDGPGGGTGGGDTPGGGTGGGSIASLSDWVRLSSSSNSAIKTYSLGSDITINFDVDPETFVVNVDGNKAWLGLSYLSKFSGKLNGNGHKIRITGTNLIGPYLFVKADGATFENVTFEGYAVRDANNCTFRNCRFIDYSLVVDATSCTFDSCRGEADMAWLSGIFRMGAVAQRAKSCTFTRCQVSGIVKGADSTGGLVGNAEGCSFTDCLARAVVSAEGNVGGLVGWAEDCEFMSSVAIGAVSGKGQTGGLVGYSKDCNYANCLAKGAVTGSRSVGGFAGDLRGGNVSQCSATGAVVCDAALGGTLDDIGGFAGQIINNARVEKCSAKGDVSAAGALMAGGFTGTITDSSAQGCCASGAVVGGGTVGGFVGTLMQGKTYNCCATGTVTAKGKSSLANAGGFAGMALSSGGADCRYCYASGKTTASGGDPMTTVAGGFTPLGVPDSMAASMGSYISMLMSDSVACYWNVTSTGCKYSGMGTGLSSANAKKQSSYSGWDFSGAWKMGGSGPELPNVGATVEDDPTSGGDDPTGGDDDPTSDPAAAVDVAGDPASGSVSGTGTYEAGETVKLTAAPAADCLFDGWYADAACTMLVSTESAWSFVVEDPAQRYFAKFSTKASKLEATRIYGYDRYVAHKGMDCWFQVGGYSPVSSTLSVSGLPPGFTYDGASMMIAGAGTRTGTYSVTFTATGAAGTVTKTVPFVVTDVNTGAEDAPCVEFDVTETAASEGGSVRLVVRGGHAEHASSATLYFTPESADAKDIDLSNVTVDGRKAAGAKFPLVLAWAAGETAERVVEIPVKGDTAVEGDETFLLQLAGVSGQDLGERRTCLVTVRDETVAATLAQAANSPSLKVSTKGDGKWIAAKGNDCYFRTAADRGVYHLQSPALAPGKTSTLELGGGKGTGKFTFAYRFVGAYGGGAAATVRILADKRPLQTDTWISHAQAGDGWSTFTVNEVNKGTHTYSLVYTQGSVADVRLEVASAQWTPTGGSAPVMVYVSSLGSDRGTVSGMGYYAPGSTAKIAAKPAPGRTFVQWYAWSAADGKYKPYATTPSLTIKVTGELDLLAEFADLPRVRAIADPADSGKVTGSGYYAAGKKVTVKATANKGCAFKGWYEHGEFVSSSATFAFEMGAVGRDLVASFISAEEDRRAIALSVGGAVADAVYPLTARNYCGVMIDWPLELGGSAATVKVSGLPAGVKLVQDKKTKAWSVSGVPTKPGEYTAVFTVTTAAKNSQTFRLDGEILSLPAAAAGTLYGLVSAYDEAEERFYRSQSLASAVLTTTVAGKISLKLTAAAGTISFAQTGWRQMMDDGSCQVLLTAKGGETVDLRLDTEPDYWNGENHAYGFVTGGIFGPATSYLEMQRSSFLKSGKENEHPEAFVVAETLKGSYFFDVRENADGYYDLVATSDKKAPITVTVKNTGAVTVAGKVDGIKVSAASVLRVYPSDNLAEIFAFAPLSKKDGASIIISLSEKTSEGFIYK